jgi:hypothetical protein
VHATPQAYLDPALARRAGCGPLALAVVAQRNTGGSWRAICRAVGCSRTSARDAYADAIRRVDEHERDHHAEREGASETPDFLRGLPMLGRGVGGAITGTRPGDPAWRVARIAAAR